MIRLLMAGILMLPVAAACRIGPQEFPWISAPDVTVQESVVLVSGRTDLPEGARIDLQVAGDWGDRASSCEVESGRYQGRVDLAGWPAGEYVLSVRFSPGGDQPAEVAKRYGYYGSRMTGRRISTDPDSEILKFLWSGVYVVVLPAQAGATDYASRFARTAEPMTFARSGHTATLLPGGQVLLAGGDDGTGPLTSAELYDPASGTFTATGSMVVARMWAVATALPDGRVLLAGGDDGTGPLASAELYDPVSGTFTATGSMVVPRVNSTATLLPGGQVLLAGGDDGTGPVTSAELYDPASGTFTATGSMVVARMWAVATALPDGRVLILGGIGSVILASAEVYDQTSGSFTPAGLMSTGRAGHTATLLEDGRVLVAGGSGDESAETWYP